MRAVRAGKLRHLVTIERPTTVVDEYGDPSLRWNEVTTRWASIEPLRGDEQIQALAVEATATHRVRFRSGVDDVSPRDRIRYGARIFQLVSALDEEERGRLVQCLAKEIDDG